MNTNEDETPMQEREVGGALRGIRIVDVSAVLAGPYCSQMLGDHGAEVIKVEPPAGDATRLFGPPYMPDGKSAYYTGINRNKKGICVDLSTEKGQQVLVDLLRSADVLIENFKAGTMERWGLGYEDTLSTQFPGLVYCRITGFGTDGPLGGLPAYDAVLQAYGGLMSVNGEADQEPLRVGVPIVDLVTGMLAFSGILLALHERMSSGKGQLVDCTLLDTAISLLHPHSASWLADGQVPRRTGSAHPSIAPYDNFATPAGPFFVGAGSDRQFEALVAVLGRPDLARDERYATNEVRVVHVESLRETLAALIWNWDRDVLGAELLKAGVPAMPVNDVSQAVMSPQALHRQMLVEMEDYRGVGVPIKLSGSPGSVRIPPPAKGADTYSVLTEAGYDPTTIGTLIAQGVLHVD